MTDTCQHIKASIYYAEGNIGRHRSGIEDAHATIKLFTNAIARDEAKLRDLKRELALLEALNEA